MLRPRSTTGALLARRLSSAAVRRLPEVIASEAFPERLRAHLLAPPPPHEELAILAADAAGTDLVLRAAMATTHLHTQSRIAAHGGYGFYTIGPCGEELLAALALGLRPTDPIALHYRHLGTLVARQLQRGHGMESILLDRARGYCTSTSDPVTAGAHCSLGADPAHDFLVTSTLASQGPQAVGRALAIEHLRGRSRWSDEAISFVSCGDGSVNNSEWLSAVNAAELLAHRRKACPTLFAISDNGISISFKTRRWTSSWVEQRLGMKVFRADGTSLPALMRTGTDAAEYVRTTRQPATLLISNLPRRFGHAATDRQSAYLSEAEIGKAVTRDPVAAAAAAAVHAGVLTEARLLEEYASIGAAAESAFGAARAEPREMDVPGLIARAAPARVPSAPPSGAPPSGRRLEMRTAMTGALDAAMASDPTLVYVGEDVEHGGYYRVTEGLADAHGRRRLFDWPPDEA